MIATAHITNCIHSTWQQYADDFVVYITNHDLNYCKINLEKAIDLVTCLLEKIGLQLSATKSNYCVFSRGHRRIVPTINIGTIALPRLSCIRYLGMWLDQRLSWVKHVNETIEKCTKFLNLLKVLVGPTWGIHQKHIRRLYIALIRSRMDYGSFFYDNSAKSNVLKLDKLQNQALRIIGGFIKSSPIHVMESELSIPPLFLRRKYQ